MIILDGLDESDDVGKHMLRQATSSSCSLLLLTRPYNLHEISTHVQIEMECMGLNYDQLKDFVHVELGLESASDLLRYLDMNPSVSQFAHVHVTTNVLCFLWKEKKEKLIGEEFGYNLFVLYEQMAFAIFRRFATKSQMKVKSDSCFKTLGNIAFEALQNEQILMSQAIVRRYNLDDASDNLIKHSGFFLLQKEETHFQFAHLTFQEFFGGVTLAKMLFDGNESKQQKAKQCISSNKLKDQFTILLTFVAQFVCIDHGYNGFERLIDIVTRSQSGKFTPKFTFLKLRIVDALVSSVKKGGHDVAILNDQLVVNIIKEVFAILKDIPKIEDDDSLSDDSESLIRVTLLVPRTMQHFSKLWHTLFEGYLSKSGKCAKSMFSAATRIARQSAPYSDEVMRRLTEDFKNEDRMNDVAFILSHAAREIPDRQDEILKLAEDGATDEDKEVRSSMAAYLGSLALEMSDRHDVIFKLAEASSVAAASASLKIASCRSDIASARLPRYMRPCSTAPLCPRPSPRPPRA